MLYHIRFFKVPTISKKVNHELNAVITIANDLGDSYFFGDVELKVDLGKGLDPAFLKWRSGSRSCSLNVKLPEKAVGSLITVSITAVMSSVRDVLEETPVFLPLKTLPFGVSTACEKLAIRYDLLSPLSVEFPRLLIAEEAGSHSLARHVWDAGLSTCQWLYSDVEAKKELLGNPKYILELGTGCGLVGLAISKMFAESTVLLTDLDDAKDICKRNIALNYSSTSKRKRDGNTSDSKLVSFDTLDWDDDNPTAISSRPWDLVIVTDCTYNPSSYGSLLNAIENVTSPGTKILLAHKYRDSDEEQFFNQLKYDRELDTTIEYYSQSVRLLLMTK